MAGQEVIVGGIAVDHAAIDVHRRDVAVALGHVLGLHPDALVEAGHLRHDVGHEVGAADVGGVVVHVVGGDQMPTVIAGMDAGVRRGAVLAQAAGGQVRVLVEAGRSLGRAGIGQQGVFVPRGAVDAAVIGQHEAALVEGDRFRVGGAGKGAEDQDEQERRKAHCSVSVRFFQDAGRPHGKSVRHAEALRVWVGEDCGWNPAGAGHAGGTRPRSLATEVARAAVSVSACRFQVNAGCPEW